MTDGKDTSLQSNKSKAAFEKAKTNLREPKGVTFPIHLDIPVERAKMLFAVQQTNSLKLSLSNARLGGENVVIDVLQMTDNEKSVITSQAKVPSQKDYDLNGTGWGGLSRPNLMKQH